MGKKPSKLPEKGADSAQELYVLIGVALSWWESSEDIILGLFREICDGIEPVAVASFIKAPRGVRYSMLNLAMETYRFRFEDGEIESVSKALKKLDSLASSRNEIAHGYVSQVTFNDDGAVTASGHYLMPSLGEGGFHERSFGYHHTPATIEAFIEELRNWRGHIMDVQANLLNRSQRQIHGVANGQFFVETARRIARLEIHGSSAVDEMSNLTDQIRRFDQGKTRH